MTDNVIPPKVLKMLPDDGTAREVWARAYLEGESLGRNRAEASVAAFDALHAFGYERHGDGFRKRERRYQPPPDAAVCIAKALELTAADELPAAARRLSRAILKRASLTAGEVAEAVALAAEHGNAIFGGLAFDAWAGELLAELEVAKRADAAPAFTVEVAKLQPRERIAFGWASVTLEGGKLLEDRQGDTIRPEELEPAVYAYVEKGGIASEMHEEMGVGRVVDSLFISAEKADLMGIPAEYVGRWWLGVRVTRPETWARVEKGELSMFSIGGRAKRAPR